MLGVDGELRYLNSKVSLYTGRSLDELREPRWREVMHPEDIDDFVLAWTRAMNGGAGIVVEFRLRRADGKFRWFRTTGTAMRKESGVIYGWCGVDIDSDDEKRVDEALRSAHSQLAQASQLAVAGELTAAMANAINQPLSAIVAQGQACLRWLSQTPTKMDRAKVAVAQIVQAGTTAAALVARIQTLATHSRRSNDPLSLNGVIDDVLRLQQAELRMHGVVVSSVLDDALPMVRADVTLVRQVLVNLIRNSIDALREQTEASRTLSVHSRSADGSVIVEVTDSGVGYRDGAPLFDAFYTTKPSGLGLGLAIAKSIVESYGGRIWHSRHGPAGSVFGFSLPV
jgi:PAS domain S-box-containing protein